MTPDESMPAPPAKRGRRKAAGDVAPAADPARAEDLAGQDMTTMSPEALARALRAVAAELERDPALAQRVATAIGGGAPEGAKETRPRASRVGAIAEPVAGEAPAATIGRTFHPTIVTGVTPDLGSGVPDPFALRARLGLDGLREALESLRLGSLRAIIREHRLDPGGRLSKLNDAAKLRERILQAAMERE